jgi:hypothetical protein
VKIFIPAPLDEAELCQPVNESDYDVLSDFVRGGDSARWTPVRVQIEHEDEGQELEYSDAPMSGAPNILILRRKAAEMLKPLFLEFGEFLPLSCDEADVVIYNPKYILSDALIEEQSVIERFDDGGIMRIERAVFDEAKIAKIDIFKISNVLNGDYYLSERFVSAWRSAGLAGLDFEEVWPNLGR